MSFILLHAPCNFFHHFCMKTSEINNNKLITKLLQNYYFFYFLRCHYTLQMS